MALAADAIEKSLLDEREPVVWEIPHNVREDWYAVCTWSSSLQIISQMQPFFVQQELFVLLDDSIKDLKRPLFRGESLFITWAAVGPTGAFDSLQHSLFFKLDDESSSKPDGNVSDIMIHDLEVESFMCLLSSPVVSSSAGLTKDDVSLISEEPLKYCLNHTQKEEHRQILYFKSEILLPRNMTEGYYSVIVKSLNLNGHIYTADSASFLCKREIIFVISPRRDMYIFRGSTQAIRWSVFGSSLAIESMSLRAELATANGTAVSKSGLDALVQNTGQYTWIVPKDLSGPYYIKIWNEADSRVYSQSQLFYIGKVVHLLHLLLFWSALEL